jgi:hypothetical protein
MKHIAKDDPDRKEFEKLYQKLLARLAHEILDLNKYLAEERLPHRRPLGSLS